MRWAILRTRTNGHTHTHTHTHNVVGRGVVKQSRPLVCADHTTYFSFPPTAGRHPGLSVPEVRPEGPTARNTEPFTFDDIFSGEFVPKRVSSEWFNGEGEDWSINDFDWLVDDWRQGSHTVQK